MPDAKALISKADIYEAAKVVELIGDNLTFKHAHALSRLVLEFGGGPVPRRGKRAPIDGATAGVLQRRGYVEPGGEESVELQARVTSILNLAGGSPLWTASTAVSRESRLTSVISASDEGIILVGRAWRQVDDKQA